MPVIYDSHLLAALGPAVNPKALPVDPFSGGTIDSVKWDGAQAGTRSIDAGRLRFDVGATWAYIERSTTQDIRGREFSFELTASAAWRAGDKACASLYDASGNNAIQLGVLSGGNVGWTIKTSGATSYTSPTVAHNGTTTRRLKIMVTAGGTITCWYGPDGIAWTQLGTAQTPSWSGSMGALLCSLEALNNTAGLNVFYDNVNV